MKTCFKSLVVGLAGSLGIGLFSSTADLEVSGTVHISAKADFYEPLTEHGTWIEAGSYGRCWRPAHVAAEWRPYCYGHWVWTDAGWFWASDEPWGWACYHYGSWVYDPGYSWIWVPDILWAPAWVSWRAGGGYIGWAPLPPRGVTIAVPPPPFLFVETVRFREPLRPSVVVVNNTTVINKTTVIKNNIREETKTFGGSSQKVMVNEGPGLDPIQKAAGKTVSPVPVREVASQTPAPRFTPRAPHEKAIGDHSAPAPTPAPGIAPVRPDKGKRLVPDEDTPGPDRGSGSERGSGKPSGGKGRGKDKGGS